MSSNRFYVLILTDNIDSKITESAYDFIIEKNGKKDLVLFSYPFKDKIIDDKKVKVFDETAFKLADSILEIGDYNFKDKSLMKECFKFINDNNVKVTKYKIEEKF